MTFGELTGSLSIDRVAIIRDVGLLWRKLRIHITCNFRCFKILVGEFVQFIDCTFVSKVCSNQSIVHYTT